MELWMTIAYVMTAITVLPPLVFISIKIFVRFYIQCIDWLEERLGL